MKQITQQLTRSSEFGRNRCPTMKLSTQYSSYNDIKWILYLLLLYSLLKKQKVEKRIWDNLGIQFLK